MHECAVEHGSFSKIDDLLAYKTNINKLREIETTPCILSDHMEKKLKSILREHQKMHNPMEIK